MAVQYGIYTGAELFCFGQNRRRRWAVLPWRTPSRANDFVQTPDRSDYEKARLASEIDAEVTPNLFAQAQNPLSPAELHSLYAGTSVPQHRYLSSALFTAVNSPAIALDPAKWFTGIEDVDLSSVTGAWLRTNGDCTFEQLKCVGFDQRCSQFIAVMTIKQHKGYSGGRGTAGSQEFVAFWVDWGSGFQYEGTASAAVFDSDSLPASGLEIRVGLPVDLSLHAPAEGLAAATIKVRAVLSWNTPPSTIHPFAPVVWGNSLDLRLVISSHRAVRANQEDDIFAGPRHGNSAFTFNADDFAGRVPCYTPYRSEPIDWVSDAALC
jgi:hypothetical protein